MTVELAVPENTAAAAVVPVQISPLAQWAIDAREAAQIGESLCRTSFVPSTMRGKPLDVAAAILAGQELGFRPMAALRSMDIIGGVPALRAHAMRGLVQSHGHKVELVEQSPTKVIVRGKRKGERVWQTVEWTIERAKQMGLTGRGEWPKQPQTMLTARATGELCRLIASDVLFAMPYAAEELDRATGATTGIVSASVTASEILGDVDADEAAEIEAAADAELDEYDGQEHDDHPDGHFDPWCGACVAESAEMDRAAADE